MKIKGLLPKGEEDLMQGKLLGHKEEGTIMMQMVGRLLMGNPTKMCHQDAAHNVPHIALTGEGVVAQDIALLHQVKTRKDTQDTREGGHQLLHLLLQIHHQRLPHQDPSQRGRGHRRLHPAWKRSHRMEKFKEGGKNITFLSYDGAYGATDCILGFIQQFDSAFGGEYFEERSKLRHVAMYFQKSARQWWASLRTRGIAPKTWKECRRAIMKQFLTDEAEDNVLTAWRSLTLELDKIIQKYVDKFWDAHLKATVFKRIEFAEQKQQFCARRPKDLKAYVNGQKPRTISAFIHHTLVASKIFPNALNATKNVNRTPQGDKSHQGNKITSFHKPQGEKKKDKGVLQG